MNTSTKVLPKVCCPCDQQSAAEDGPVTFTQPTAFRSVASKTDLDDIISHFPVTLLIGVFSWSNFSLNTFLELASDEDWFTSRSIGLGVMCFGSPTHTQKISAEVHSHFAKANREPILYCFFFETLRDVTLGPRKLEEIKNWLLALSNNPA